MASGRRPLRNRGDQPARRYVSSREKKGGSLSPRRRAELIARYAKTTRLIEHPEEIAKLSDASLELTLRVITHFIHEVREQRIPLLDLPSESVLRSFKRTPAENRIINRLSEQTEKFAATVFKNAVIRPSMHPGHDLFLPLRKGGIEIDVKMVLNNSESAFFPLATPYGKLKPQAADVFAVFVLDGLFLVRKNGLKNIVEKNPGQFYTQKKDSRQKSFVPLGDLVRLGLAEKIPYRQDVGSARFGIPCPPHFMPFRQAARLGPFGVPRLIRRMAASNLGKA